MAAAKHDATAYLLPRAAFFMGIGAGAADVAAGSAVAAAIAALTCSCGLWLQVALPQEAKLDCCAAHPFNAIIRRGTSLN